MPAFTGIDVKEPRRSRVLQKDLRLEDQPILSQLPHRGKLRRGAMRGLNAASSSPSARARPATFLVYTRRQPARNRKKVVAAGGTIFVESQEVRHGVFSSLLIRGRDGFVKGRSNEEKLQGQLPCGAVLFEPIRPEPGVASATARSASTRAGWHSFRRRFRLLAARVPCATPFAEGHPHCSAGSSGCDRRARSDGKGNELRGSGDCLYGVDPHSSTRRSNPWPAARDFKSAPAETRLLTAQFHKRENSVRIIVD